MTAKAISRMTKAQYASLVKRMSGASKARTKANRKKGGRKAWQTMLENLGIKPAAVARGEK